MAGASYDFRLLDTGFNHAYYNMGLDQSILESVSRGEAPPTLRLYGWNPPAVSIGYFQGAGEELNLEACSRRGIDVVRRITGGGAVFHRAELTYSMVVPLDHPLAGKTILSSYESLCGGLIEGFSLLGVEARFAPVNDIVSGGRKISGNAQTRKMGCLLLHGTVLLDVDVALMFELLNVPSEKLKDKLIADVSQRVTGLRSLLGRAVSFEEARDVFAEGFRRGLGLSFIGNSRISGPEQSRAVQLAEEHFSDPRWIYKRP
ncbi:lipoate--protein ligase family protein [Breznakiella homolactica]|uniref:Lipoate--protein ligase family protein n=1 Tax=Breznakiella homolactica TaxID=2798577 RepID=A0A7T8B7C4_9SPIR|nr:lipoate--protein ligase family protein [Breznakiella homolactica]QQO07369.1 lipoate--protein ligase family protein [Breznakiella homolactica]